LGGFAGGRGGAEEVHFFRNGAAEIVEGFADVGWVVVGFICILRALGVRSVYVLAWRENLGRKGGRTLHEEASGGLALGRRRAFLARYSPVGAGSAVVVSFEVAA
jgi:hypothetical protein